MKPRVSAYLIEPREILVKLYQLVCLFLANKQISRIAHPQDPKEPLKKLETRFLFQQASTLLLEVAILFRALDDQKRRSPDSEECNNYLKRLEDTNRKYGPMMFDEELGIRECCNKIIHAVSFEPHMTESDEAHSKDHGAYYGGYERELQWHHLSGNIRISGSYRQKEWAFLLQIPEFVEGMSYLLDDG